MKKYYIVFFLIGLLFWGCENSNDDGKISNTNEIIPLKVGNFWKYEVRNYSTRRDSLFSPDTLLISVVDKKEIKGQTWYAWRIDNGKLSYIANKSDGFWLATLNKLDSSSITDSTLALKYPTENGDMVTKEGTSDTCYTINNNYSVSTPWGNKKGVFYKSDINSENYKEYTLIPNLGIFSQKLITYIDKNTNPYDTIWVYWNLIDYKLN